jgi:hypothetical protein
MGRSTSRAACFFINKSDRENADPTAALDALRATFGNKIAPRLTSLAPFWRLIWDHLE